MAEGKLILVCGGSRSGKSKFAEKLASDLGGQVIYIATSQILDEEMEHRAAAHRLRRPAHWETVEEPMKVAETVRARGEKGKVILIDCLTLFLTNLLLEEDMQRADTQKREELILAKVEELAATARKTAASVIVVTNEVGMGIVPDTPLGREFRDIEGKANQVMARYADEVYFTLLGIPVELRALNRLNERISTRVKEEDV